MPAGLAYGGIILLILVWSPEEIEDVKWRLGRIWNASETSDIDIAHVSLVR